jgi:hypothetical protein
MSQLRKLAQMRLKESGKPQAICLRNGSLSLLSFRLAAPAHRRGTVKVLEVVR